MRTTLDLSYCKELLGDQLECPMVLGSGIAAFLSTGSKIRCLVTGWPGTHQTWLVPRLGLSTESANPEESTDMGCQLQSTGILITERRLPWACYSYNYYIRSTVLYQNHRLMHATSSTFTTHSRTSQQILLSEYILARASSQIRVDVVLSH